MELQNGMNPIRRVVNLLQGMQKKVTAEGEAEAELYAKFMCYCKTGTEDLEASIAAAEAKGPALASAIEAAEGKLAQAKEDLKSAKVGREEAKKAAAEAEAIRAKEAAAFASYKAEADTNVAAMEKAIAALEKGMSGSFLQTTAAQAILKLAQSSSDILVDADRQELVSFLSGSSEYAPSSGEIVGILKQMHETMSKDLSEANATEEAAVKAHAGLIAAKAKEVEALSATIEAKTTQIGEIGLDIVEMKEELGDAGATLEADKKFLAELKTSCGTKTAEWEERKKTRAEELVALSDTIRILNDDDALDLFKKTLPGAASSSFMQVSSGVANTRARAVDILSKAQAKAPRDQRSSLDFLVLTLTGKKALNQGGFDKVIKMVDDMIAVLKKEQVDDDAKKEYCATQFDTSDDKKKALERTVEEHENAIATAKEAITTLTEEIAALEKGIKELDNSVVEATEQRKAENVEYKELLASDSAAKDLLNFAKNRLNKFYNPKLFKSAPKRELSESERIAVNMGGTPPPTDAPGGIAGTGISAFVQISEHRELQKDAPAPPPETWGAYAKKGEESTGVIAMIDLLIRDLEKELTEAATEEKNSQASYEKMMSDSATKRAADSKLLAEKGSTKADTEAELQAREEGKEAAVKEHMATMKYIQSLHSECDWLVQYYDVRKEARAGEVDSLQKAKAVLSGADFSFLQQRAGGFLQRRSS